ncbi:MAG: hypothetical protein ACI4HO_04405 [Ruminococcus sp.]
MKNWNVLAIYIGGKNADEEMYGTKRQAVRVAKKKLAEGEKYECITVIADNGEELLDETEIKIK